MSKATQEKPQRLEPPKGIGMPPKPWTFTIEIEGADLSGDYMGALREAGCDDCTPRICEGRLWLTFTREAGTSDAAIDAALADIELAEIGGKPVVVKRDLRS